MSQVAISGNASGTGTLTIAAPNTNSNYTLTLPQATTTLAGTDATQTLTNKTLTSPTLTTPNIDSAQIATVSGTAPLYMCRAWVNFNGTGTVAIRASGNVTSITDGGVGIYRVNFTSAMPDANFTTVASSAGAGSVNSSTTAMLVNATSATAQTANAAYVDVWCYHPGNQTAQDDAYINVSVFR